MAQATIVNSGLTRRLGASLDRPLWARLFRNDVGFYPGSVLGDFDTSLFPGYADIELTGLWSTPAMDPIGRAFSQVPDVTFTRGAGLGSEQAFGWLVYEDPDPDSVLVCGRRFTVPYTVNTPGQVIMFSVIAFLLRG